MKTIAILNLKGGVGKTTTAREMSIVLATEHEQRVLLVDADSQHDVTKTLLPPGEYNTLTDLLLGDVSAYHDVIYHAAVRGLDVLPADFRLATVGMSNVHGGHYFLRALADLTENLTEDDAYDYVVIDCPSAFIHPGCQAAVFAAQSIIIPIKADSYAISGAEEVATQVTYLRQLNPALSVAGALVTQYCRNEYADSAIAQFLMSAPVHVYDTKIRHSRKADGGTESAEGIMAYSPRSAVARDYRNFVAEFLGGEKK